MCYSVSAGLYNDFVAVQIALLELFQYFFDLALLDQVPIEIGLNVNASTTYSDPTAFSSISNLLSILPININHN